MDNNWIRDLEAREPKARLINRYRPAPDPPRRVDMNDDESRLIRQTLLRIERERSTAIIIWLAVLLVGSAAANLFQGLLYLEALQRLN